MQKWVQQAFETFDTIGKGQSHEKMQLSTKWISSVWAMLSYERKKSHYNSRPL